MSGATTIEMVDIANKMPRTFTSLNNTDHLAVQFLILNIVYIEFSYLISVTYAEHGALIKPQPKPNKKVATITIHTDDEQ